MAVDLTLAKSHLRVDSSDEDTLITAYLAAVMAWVENYTGKKLTNSVVTQEEAAFREYLLLNWGPAQSDLTITYTDIDGAEQAITNAKIVADRAYPTEAWPSIAENTPITLTYTAGYASTPGDLDAAVLLLLGDLYANRETGDAAPAVAMAVEALCRPYRPVRV